MKSDFSAFDKLRPRNDGKRVSHSRSTLLLATRNRHKVKEFRRIFRGSGVRFVALDRFPDISGVDEDGATFEANALKKAVQTSRHTLLPVLAEDSGLEVRALGGRPGVCSARFAGAAQSDSANNAKLIRAMAGVPASRRQARYVCVMALAVGGKPARTFRGSCPGFIAKVPAGRRGFGYDPLFIPRGAQKTAAQLPAGEKDRWSHRAAAARRLKEWFKRPRRPSPAG